MLVAGAPWHMQHCILRATEMPVLRACAAAKVSLNDSFVHSPNRVSMNYHEESTSYTQVVEVAPGVVVVCYDKIGNNEYTKPYNPPPYSNAAPFDFVFCVRVTVG